MPRPWHNTACDESLQREILVCVRQRVPCMTNKNTHLGLSQGLLWLETLHVCCHRKSAHRVTPQVSERAGGSLRADSACVPSLTICSRCLCRSDICQLRRQLNAEFHQSFQRSSKSGHGLGDSYLTCR